MAGDHDLPIQGLSQIQGIPNFEVSERGRAVTLEGLYVDFSGPLIVLPRMLLITVAIRPYTSLAARLSSRA